MPSTASTVRDYYYAHFGALPQDKQFHFVSRLGSWNNDTQALDKLEALRPTFATPDIKGDLRRLIAHPPTAKINAIERRAPYFAKYPQLRGYMLALFRVRHLLFHYDIDARDILLDIVAKDELYTLSDALQNDHEAVATLSTYAINYIYLVEMILFPSNDRPLHSFLADVLALAATYDDTPEDSLLLIYLFTHCIIGASNFYQSKVSLENTPEYRTMLEIIETRIAAHFTAINLDNKFEFLVCCRLTDFTTNLDGRIQRETEQSYSPNGTFLIDTVNTAGQSNKTSFADSEHRNVLYIMSQTKLLK